MWEIWPAACVHRDLKHRLWWPVHSGFSCRLFKHIEYDATENPANPRRRSAGSIIRNLNTTLVTMFFFLFVWIYQLWTWYYKRKKKKHESCSMLNKSKELDPVPFLVSPWTCSGSSKANLLTSWGISFKQRTIWQSSFIKRAGQNDCHHDKHPSVLFFKAMLLWTMCSCDFVRNRSVVKWYHYGFLLLTLHSGWIARISEISEVLLFLLVNL